MQISRVQRNLLNGYILIQLYPSVLIFYFFSRFVFFSSLLKCNSLIFFFALSFSFCMAFQLRDTYIYLNVHSKVKPYTVVWLIIDFALVLLSKIARIPDGAGTMFSYNLAMLSQAYTIVSMQNTSTIKKMHRMIGHFFSKNVLIT